MVQGTGTLIKKVDAQTYQMLTSASLVKMDVNAENLTTLDSGHFMLNKDGAGTKYHRRFKVLKETIKTFDGFDDDYQHGGDFALVSVQLVDEANKIGIPEDPFKEYQTIAAMTRHDSYLEELQIAGYPQKWNDKKSMNFLYSDTGSAQPLEKDKDTGAIIGNDNMTVVQAQSTIG